MANVYEFRLVRLSHLGKSGIVQDLGSAYRCEGCGIKQNHNLTEFAKSQHAPDCTLLR